MWETVCMTRSVMVHHCVMMLDHEVPVVQCTGLLLPPEKACVRHCPEEQKACSQGPRAFVRQWLHVPQDGGPCSTEAGKRQNVIRAPEFCPIPLPCRACVVPCLPLLPGAVCSWQAEKQHKPSSLLQGRTACAQIWSCEPIPIRWCSAAWRRRRRRRGSRR